ncbi:MAG: DNA polymerase Y family protein, partial [Candidatus Binatia bacterium]
LRRHSPELEPSADTPGLFWVNASGLGLLYPELQSWTAGIDRDLKNKGWRACVVVGFTRFGTYALARSGTRSTVLESIEQEIETTKRVGLANLGLEPALLANLEKLGVRSIGTFLRLPPAGILERFGHKAVRLHAMASNATWAPLQPLAPERPCTQSVVLDNAVIETERLLFIIRRLLDELLVDLAGRGRAIGVLHVLMVLGLHGNVVESVQPATPTLEAGTLMELLSLRLNLNRLPAGVQELELRAELVDATSEQLRFFNRDTLRDLTAAQRALARVRAEFGDNTVAMAKIREGHLPEAGFRWEPTTLLRAARPRNVRHRPLIRRIYRRPFLLPQRPHNSATWSPQGKDSGPVLRSMGPYIVSGGWWAASVHREYWFVETRRGDMLWIYYDRPRRRWYLHGRVE